MLKLERTNISCSVVVREVRTGLDQLIDHFYDPKVFEKNDFFKQKLQKEPFSIKTIK